MARQKQGSCCLLLLLLLLLLLAVHLISGAGGEAALPDRRPVVVRAERASSTPPPPPQEGGQPPSAPPPPPPRQSFATENNTLVTAQTGSTGLLPCIINNIGDGIISWIRRKDYHLLTVGLTTYSSDQRFQAIHLLHSEDWTLKIKFVQKRDAGIYECQISSHPPTSIFLRLEVVEARAQILGPTEKYLKPGSALKLQCTVLRTTEPPAFVFWYHNDRMINYDTERGVNVTTDVEQRLSHVRIPSAAARHAGNYSCVPNNAVPASVYVHIINGENPAAMQSGGTHFLGRGRPATFVVTVFTLAALATS